MPLFTRSEAASIDYCAPTWVASLSMKKRIRFSWACGFALFVTVGVTGAAFAQGPSGPPPPGTPLAAGQQIFLTRCASCHGTTGNGGEFAPGITARIPLRSDDDLIRILHGGLPNSGMPAFPDVVDPDRANLIAYLRTLHASGGAEITHIAVQLEGGGTLAGSALNRSATSIQLLGEDEKVHLLRKTSDGRYRTVTSQQDWPSYNGDTVGYRYSDIAQITAANAGRLAPVWIHAGGSERHYVRNLGQ